MVRRIESPSSIKTFHHCPRKYYYQYIAELPTGTSIHLVRGKVVHSVLESFFDQNVSHLTDTSALFQFRELIQQQLVDEWRKNTAELRKLNLSNMEQVEYFEETLLMLWNWLGHFVKRLKKVQQDGKTLQEAFTQLTPIRERQYISQEHQVQGFIDCIESNNGIVRVMDYKTNARINMNDHKLQLAIYSLLYHEKHGRLPDEAGIYFLRHTEQTIPVNVELLQYAKKQVVHVHENTHSNNMEDYPKNISPLCKWKTGQCDFYEYCFGQRTLREFSNGKPKEQNGRHTNGAPSLNGEEEVNVRLDL